MGARDAKPVQTQGRDGCRDTKFKVLIHKKFRPYGCEGQFKPHAVGIACLEHTGCHTIQPKLTSQIKGKADIFNLAAT